MAHRAEFRKASDFSSPWKIRVFREKKSDKILWHCSVCEFSSKRRKYNRRDFKKGKEYFYTEKYYSGDVP